MGNLTTDDDGVSPTVSTEEPPPAVGEKSSPSPPALSKTGEKDGDAPKEEDKSRPERVSGFKDYLRVFSYATKFDIALLVAATIASIGAGVVRPQFT